MDLVTALQQTQSFFYLASVSLSCFLFVIFSVTTHSRFGLWKMGISHVLNAAHSTLFCQEPHDFFGTTIEYHGVPAHDLPEFDISSFFYSAAEFIHKALNTPGGMKSLLVRTADILKLYFGNCS